MSTRAYFIKSRSGSIPEENASFNAWHESSLMDYLLDKLDIYPKYESGIIKIATHIMEDALLNITWSSPESKAHVEDDVKWAKGNNIKTMRYDFG